MKTQEIMLAVREKNGQIGYLSDGIAIPEFVDLIRYKDQNQSQRILVDFSPLIEKLHSMHQSFHDEAVLIKYNHMYNFWQDAKTYTIESAKIHSNSELTKLSNSLISELQISLQKRESLFYSDRQDYIDIVRRIKKDCDIYIDALLCFIHSKASLDIDSFRADTVLGSYADYLHKYVYRLYQAAIRGQYRDSFLKFVAIEHPQELQAYLNLEEVAISPDSFKLRLISEEKPYWTHDEHLGDVRELSIRYQSYNLALIEILRDLVYKARSLQRFLALLKEGKIKWDNEKETVDSLVEEIRLIGR